MANTISPDGISPPPITGPGTSVVITDPIVIRGMRGYDLDLKGTRYVYRGPRTIGLIQLIGCYWTKVRNFFLYNETEGVEYGVLLANPPSVGQNTHACTIEDGDIQNGGKLVKYGYGISSRAFGGVDANNELNTFRNCYSRFHSKAGFYISEASSQAYQTEYDRCCALSYQGKHEAEFAFLFERYGSFHMRRCSTWGHQTDIRINTPGRPSISDNFISEHAKRLLVTNYTSAIGMFTMRGTAWNGEPVEGVPVIEVNHPGHVEFNCLQMSGLLNITPEIRFNASPLWPWVGRKVSGLSVMHHGSGPVNNNLLRFTGHPSGQIVEAAVLTRLNSDGSRVTTPIVPAIV